MDINPMVLQFGGSLLAVLALAGLARLLRLGGTPALRDESAAARAASEVEDGFEAHRITLDRKGAAALLRDAEGRIMVIKRHGNRFAGRVLTGAASAREEVDALVVDPGPGIDATRFGTVRLALKDAASWADAINRL